MGPADRSIVLPTGDLGFTMPRVFVGGPYRSESRGVEEDNIRQAEIVGIRVAQMGAVPVIFHTACQCFQGLMSESFMDEVSLQLLSTCQAVAITCSEARSRQSVGTLKDLGMARRLELPVFFAVGANGDEYHGNYVRGGMIALKTWISEWKIQFPKAGLHRHDAAAPVRPAWERVLAAQDSGGPKNRNK